MRRTQKGYWMRRSTKGYWIFVGLMTTSVITNTATNLYGLAIVEAGVAVLILALSITEARRGN